MAQEVEWPENAAVTTAVFGPEATPGTKFRERRAAQRSLVQPVAIVDRVTPSLGAASGEAGTDVGALRNHAERERQEMAGLKKHVSPNLGVSV